MFSTENVISSKRNARRAAQECRATLLANKKTSPKSKEGARGRATKRALNFGGGGRGLVD